MSLLETKRKRDLEHFYNLARMLHYGRLEDDSKPLFSVASHTCIRNIVKSGLE